VSFHSGQARKAIRTTLCNSRRLAPPAACTDMPNITAVRKRARSAGLESGGRSPSDFARFSRWCIAASPFSARDEFLPDGFCFLPAGERPMDTEASGRTIWIGQQLGRTLQQSLGHRARRRFLQARPLSSSPLGTPHGSPGKP
jgi:hypothetical protein